MTSVGHARLIIDRNAAGVAWITGACALILLALLGRSYHGNIVYVLVVLQILGTLALILSGRLLFGAASSVLLVAFCLNY